MKERLVWFLLGAVTASVFWGLFLLATGQQWLDVLLRAG